MSTREQEHVRDVDLRRRLTLALGGVPTLRLVLAGERPEPRSPRNLEASRAALDSIFHVSTFGRKES
jgi:hypothetical protein